MEQFTHQLESMLNKNKDFSQQLKQRLFLESVNVKNPLNFVVSLFLEGVLNDQGGQQDTNVGLTIGFIVQLVIMMACSKGAKGINGLMKALEASGNAEFISALRKWVKEDLATETGGQLRNSRKKNVSAAITTAKLFIDTMISRIREQLMGQLASNVVNFTKDESNLVHNDSILEETNIESASANFGQVHQNSAHQKDYNEPQKPSLVPPTTEPRVQERSESTNDPIHFDINTESKCVPKRDDTALEPDNSENLPKGKKSSIQMSSDGTKLINKIISYVDNDLTEPLKDFWVSKATEIVNVPKFCSSMLHQMVLEEYDIQLLTGPKVQEGQQVEKIIKAACSKKAIGSLVIALQNSKNERILLETCEWIDTLPARKKRYPITVESLAVVVAVVVVLVCAFANGLNDNERAKVGGFVILELVVVVQVVVVVKIMKVVVRLANSLVRMFWLR